MKSKKIKILFNKRGAERSNCEWHESVAFITAKWNGKSSNTQQLNLSISLCWRTKSHTSSALLFICIFLRVPVFVWAVKIAIESEWMHYFLFVWCVIRYIWHYVECLLRWEFEWMDDGWTHIRMDEWLLHQFCSSLHPVNVMRIFHTVCMYCVPVGLTVAIVTAILLYALLLLLYVVSLCSMSCLVKVCKCMNEWLTDCLSEWMNDWLTTFGIRVHLIHFDWNLLLLVHFLVLSIVTKAHIP